MIHLSCSLIPLYSSSFLLFFFPFFICFLVFLTSFLLFCSSEVLIFCLIGKKIENATGRAGTEPHMDGTPELTLFMEGAGEQACGFETKRVAPAHSLICHEMSRIKVIFSSPNPLLLMTGERSDLRDMRKGKKPVLSLIKCSNPESRACHLPGKNRSDLVV